MNKTPPTPSKEEKIKEHFSELKKQISDKVWNEIQPKVKKQCEDAFREFENMFEVKSYEQGKQAGIIQTKEKVLEIIKEAEIQVNKDKQMAEQKSPEYWEANYGQIVIKELKQAISEI